MDTLTVLLIFVTSLYLLIYQTSFWKYYLGILIPYYVITQIILCDFKTNTSKKNSLCQLGHIHLIVKYIVQVK